MITYIKGELAELRLNSVVVDTNGIGYEVFVPLRVIYQLQGSVGTVVQVHTFFHVKEDGVALYGFLSKDDLTVFRMLITVSGIGPKGALSVLSSMTADDLRWLVISEDVKSIAKTPGIGQKTAAKLVLELKDKFKADHLFLEGAEGTNSNTTANLLVSPARQECIQALTALGYSITDATKAVQDVIADETATVEQILKLSLRNL